MFVELLFITINKVNSNFNLCHYVPLAKKKSLKYNQRILE